MLLSRLPGVLRLADIPIPPAPAARTTEEIEGLANPVAASSRAAVPVSSSRTAAVALVLRPPPGRTDPCVEDSDALLIRRADSSHDPWSGQMALPGGRWEEGDASLAATAIRETWEETGLDLARPHGPIGSLPPVDPSTPRLPPLTIWPFVFLAPPSAHARAASSEVASVHWLSVRRLRARQSRAVHRCRVGDASLSFPCFRVDGQVVWGLTYRILDGFLAMW